MQATTRNLEQLFGGSVSYQIPLFQRRYVWTEEENWAPLWEDLQDLLDATAMEQKVRPHFLGATVLEQLPTATGSIETRQVIDGQQRFTTIQLILLAARCVSYCNNFPSLAQRFDDLVENPQHRIDYHHEQFKVWPTNSDRPALEAVHEADHPSALGGTNHERTRIGEAYAYFYDKLYEWVTVRDSELSDADPEHRIKALWSVVRQSLQLVVIDLGEDDESQVIFETLNARGTQLLPADLIKNYLFHEAQAEGQDIYSLYNTYWAPFDSGFWETYVKQGRIKRPRIDIFLQHYLTLQMRDDVRSTHIFNSFKTYVQRCRTGQTGFTDEPADTVQHLSQLQRYAQSFIDLIQAEPPSRCATFMERLAAIDTATVYPILLLARDRLVPTEQEEFDSILHLLESFLIRRMICGLGTKHYNRLMLDLIRALGAQETVSAEAVARYLSEGEGENTRFPDNDEIREAFKWNPVYRWWPQYRTRAVLKALEYASAHGKSESLNVPDNLTIEHVMPVNWEENWPVPEASPDSADSAIDAADRRNRLIHTFGNLTLMTKSLNPAVSNWGWEDKWPQLHEYSRMNLTRYFYRVGKWDEEEIVRRSEHLAELASSVWPAVDYWITEAVEETQ